MATLQQVEDAIRAAAAKGNRPLVQQLAKAREQLLAEGQGGPTAEAGDVLRRRQIEETAATYDKQSPWDRLKATVGDLGTMAEQGVTLGFADEINAGLEAFTNPNKDYAQAKLEQERMVQDAKARMNSNTPYSAETLEGLTSMTLPTGAAKILPEAGALTKGLIYGTEGALQSGASSLGHGSGYKDALIDAGIGGVFGGTGGLLANPVAKWAGGGRKEFQNADELFDAQAAKPQNKGLKQRTWGMEDALLAEAGNPRKRMATVAAANDKTRNTIRAKGPRAVTKEFKPTREQQLLIEQIANAGVPTLKNAMTEIGRGLRGGGGWGALYANLLNVPGALMEGTGKIMSNKPKAALRQLKNSYLGGTPDNEAAMQNARDILSKLAVGSSRAQPMVFDGEPQNVDNRRYSLFPPKQTP